MLGKLRDAILPSARGGGLARSFTRVGWAGFWLQLLVGAVPVLLMAYYFFFASPVGGTRRGLVFVEYLAVANLSILAFTTFWSYRYARIGRSLAEPATSPSPSSLIGIVWTGVVASALGMFSSMAVLLLETAHLLFYFLKAPQAGVQVIQTTSGELVSWVSAVDMLSLAALIFTLMAELLVLVFGLWLLFRTSASAGAASTS